MAKQTNFELLNKFEKMKRWMVDDTERAMFTAKANFLVAQGLFNYTEIIGSFLEPYGKKSGVKFDAFFSRLGPEYRENLKKFNRKRKKDPHVIYDDLRCGLSHEYVIKRKEFTIYGTTGSGTPTDADINNLKILVNGIKINCSSGVIYVRDKVTGQGSWHIVNPKYWLDFKNALDVYWQEINNPKNKDLRKKFFYRARKINFLKFS